MRYKAMGISWVDNMLDEVCVYWDPPKRDGLGGYEWAYPEELLSSWQYGPKRQDGPVLIYTTAGSEIVSRTEVWVNHDIELGGYLWKGSINDLQTIFKPDPIFEEAKDMIIDVEDLAAQIVEVKLVKSLVDKRIVVRKAYLR